MIKGRWMILVDEPESIARDWADVGPLDHGCPAVPCDDAAVERGAEALEDLLLMLGVEPTYAPEHAPSETVKRTLARAVLRAAGEVEGDA